MNRLLRVFGWKLCYDLFTAFQTRMINWFLFTPSHVWGGMAVRSHCGLWTTTTNESVKMCRFNISFIISSPSAFICVGSLKDFRLQCNTTRMQLQSMGPKCDGEWMCISVEHVSWVKPKTKRKNKKWKKKTSTTATTATTISPFVYCPLILIFFEMTKKNEDTSHRLTRDLDIEATLNLDISISVLYT